MAAQSRAGVSDPERFVGWRDAGVDPTRPSIARVYDYWLGGTHNLAADRELGSRMETLDPRIPAACKANRAFLGRAVRFLAGQAGVRQFIDIGSGIPTAGNVHEVAQRAAPSARVLYVDRDPIAVAEGRKLLAGNPLAAVIQADLRDPAAIVSHPEAARLIDFAEPVGLILVAVLHFLVDADQPQRAVQHLQDTAGPGSYLVVSHVTDEGNPKLAAVAEEIYNAGAADGQPRSRAEILGFFGTWELAEPGLVYAPLWRPAAPQDVPSHSEQYWFLAGVARRPEPVRMSRSRVGRS
jgi:SAM-dependent methyltransferase